MIVIRNRISYALIYSGKRHNIGETDLTYADLRSLDLSSLDFSSCILTNADMSNSNCHGSIFDRAVMKSIKAANTNFSYTSFRKADLTYADMTNTNIFGSDMKGATLTNANFSNCFGNQNQVKSFGVEKFVVNWTTERIQVGSILIPLSAIDDGKLPSYELNMTPDVRQFWDFWKDTIIRLVTISPAL